MKEIYLNVAVKLLSEVKHNKRMFYLWNSSISELMNGTEDIIDRVKLAYLRMNEIESDNKSIELFKKFSNIENARKKAKKNGIEERIISLDREKEIDYSTITYNDFAFMDLDTFLIGLVWIETVGKLIDNRLGDKIYANRISKSSKSFFKPYFSMYGKFRDDSLKEMKYIIDKKESAVTVQLDLEKCFYHVNLFYLKSKVDTIIDESSKEGETESNKRINDFVFKYLFSYAENSMETSRLAIGFLPSNILINLYLSELDNIIMEELHPISYGRYVDDILMVVQKDFPNNNDQAASVNNIEIKLKEIMKKFNRRVDDEAQKYFTSLNSAILNITDYKTKRIKTDFNNSKNIYFIITKNDDYNYIYKFMNSVKTLSSDFYKLVDVSIMEEDINRAYQIVESPIKFSEILEIKKDKKHLSKIISAVCFTIFSSLQEETKNYELAKKFMKKFNEFIDDEFLIELYDYWFPIAAIELVSVLEKNELVEILNIDEKKYEDLIIVKKLKSLNNESIKSYPIKFIEEYLRSLEEIFIEGRKIGMKKLAKNYLVPAFMNMDLKENNDLIKERLINLNYEKQLSVLCTNLSNKEAVDFKDIEKFINTFNGEETNSSDNDPTYKCENIKIGQVNIYNPDERINNYVKYYTNYNSSSDTITALNMAAEKHLDLLIFPEQGLRINDLYTVCKMARKNNLAIIGGLDYFCIGKYILNMSFSVIPREKKDSNGVTYFDCEIQLSPKRYLAPTEYELFMNSNAHHKIIDSKLIYVPNDPNKLTGIHFTFKGSRHSILNCYEATDIGIRCKIVDKESHLVHLITNNRDVEYYDKLGETISRDLMCITTITNYSVYGGTQVYIPYKDRFRRVVSYQKGSEITNVSQTEINVQNIVDKRFNNLSNIMKQNPPRYYYQNIRG